MPSNSINRFSASAMAAPLLAKDTRARRTRTTALAVFGFFAAAIVVAVVVVSADEQRQVAMPAALLLISVLLPAAKAFATDELDLFEPVQIISAMVALNFGLRALYVVWGHDRPRYWLFGRGDYLQLVGPALWLTLLGYWCLLIGYYFFAALNRFRRRRPVGRWPVVLPASAIIALYVVGVTASAYRIATGGLVGSDPVLAARVTMTTYAMNSLTQCIAFAAVLPLLHTMGGGRLTRMGKVTHRVAWVTLIVQSLLFGSKTILFAPLFACALYYNQYIRRLRVTTILATALPLTIVVLPILNIYRGDFYGGRQAPSNISEALADLRDLPEAFVRYTSLDLLVLGPEMTINRSHGIDSLAIVMSDPQRVSNVTGSLQLWAIPIYAYVPRALWSAKPSANAAIEFGRDYAVSAEAAAASYTAVGMFNLSDFYARGGVLGVMVGMAVLGLLFRCLYDYMRRSVSQAVLFVYSFVLWQIMNGFEGDVVSVYSGALRSLVALAMAVWVVRFTGRLWASAGGINRPGRLAPQIAGVRSVRAE